MALQQSGGGMIKATTGQDTAIEAIQFNVGASSSNMRLSYVPPKVIDDYQFRYVPDKTPVIRPTRSIVISQDPPAGQVVPAGTVVKVTMIDKGIIPVNNFQTGSQISAKYGTGNISAVLGDLDTKGQTVTPILDTETPYESLSASQKTAVVQYAQSIGLNTANDADTKSAYEDLMFFNNL